MKTGVVYKKTKKIIKNYLMCTFKKARFRQTGFFIKKNCEEYTPLPLVHGESLGWLVTLPPKAPNRT